MINKKEKINKIMELINNLENYNIHDLHQLCLAQNLYTGQEAGFRAFCKKHNIPIRKKDNHDDFSISTDSDKIKEISIDKLQPSLPMDMICDCCHQKKSYIIAQKGKENWNWKYCYFCYSNLQHMNLIPNEKTI